VREPPPSRQARCPPPLHAVAQSPGSRPTPPSPAPLDPGGPGARERRNRRPSPSFGETRSSRPVKMPLGLRQAGFSETLVDLRKNAAEAGMNMQQYSEFVVTNGDAIQFLGKTTTDGARNLALMSRRVREVAKDNNMFGLSISELNQVMVEEINIRRMGGATQMQATRDVEASMKDLMLNATALSSVFGIDRREILRKRQDMVNDVTLNLANQSEQMRTNLTKFVAIFEGRGGDAGEQVAMAITRATQTGRLFESFGAEIGQMSQLSQGYLQRFQDFVRDNAESMPTEQFTSELGAMMTEMSKAFGDAEYEQLTNQANSGIEGAANLLEILNGFRGIKGTPEELEDAINKTKEAAVSPEAALMALPAALTELGNKISSSALTTILSTLGANVESSGSVLVGAINNLADNFGFDPITDEFRGFFSGIGTTMMEFPKTVSLIVGGLLGAWAILKGISVGLSKIGAGIGASASKLLGATSILSKVTGTLGFVAKRFPLVAAAIGASTGLLDKDLHDSGYGGLDKAAIGVFDSGLKMFDIGAGITEYIIESIAGKDLFKTQNTSSVFNDWVTRDGVADVLTFGSAKGNRESRGVSNYSPVASSAVPTSQETSPPRVRPSPIQNTNNGPITVRDQELLDEIRRLRRIIEDQ